MSPYWKSFVGASVAGRYPLLELLGETDAGAFFASSPGGGGRAVIKLVPEDDRSSAAQLSVWRRSRQLSHPHLLRLLDYGRADLPSGPFLYGVFEYPDDNAAAALQHGLMTPEEARDVLLAIGPALREIHAAGLVHRAVDPEHIVAVGDRVKLAADTVGEPSPEHAPEDDVRDLAATVCELLRGTRPGPNQRGIADVPEPFRSAAARAFATPASVDELLGIVDGAPAKAPVAEAPAPPPAPPPAAAREVRTVRPPKWAFAAAAVAIAGGIVAVSRYAGSWSGTAPAAAVVPAVSAPKLSSVAPRAAPAVKSPEPAGSGVWRVIAYTYSARKHAEKKAESINRRWPGLHASVFAPRPGDRGPYFVALGGRMSRREAERLRKQAVGRGLPRDTFVRNFSR